MANRPLTPLDLMQQVVNGEVPRAPSAQLIGFAVIEVGVGRAVVELLATEQHSNPMGTLHGGIICTVADTAAGVAFWCALEAGETYTTVDFHINFLKPVFQGLVRAEASVIKLGQTIGLVQCVVTNGEGSMVAYATATCMRLKGKQAEGR